MCPYQSILNIVFFLIHVVFFGQEIQKFTYGGSKGARYKGTVQLTYYIAQGDRKTKIDVHTTTIDLNAYNGEVDVVIEFSNLTLGLNDAYSKVRNSTHDKVFYLKACRIPINVEGHMPVGSDTLRISAKKGHYSAKIGSIRYRLQAPRQKQRLLFQLNTEIVDGVYERTWKAGIVSKSLYVLPRAIVEKDTLPLLPQKKEILETKRKGVARRTYVSSLSTQLSKDTIAPAIALEERVWQKIQEQVLKNNKETALHYCELYRLNCTNGIFTACQYAEEALYYSIAMQEHPEQATLVIQEYEQQYPNGKYSKNILQWRRIAKPQTIPINCNKTQLDFDQNTLIVGGIYGGEPPYSVHFYDDEKNSQYALKYIPFTETSTSILLSELQLPTGYYRVTITDSKDQVFIEVPQLRITTPINIPKSISLSLIMLGVFGLGVGYRKYIHF